MSPRGSRIAVPTSSTRANRAAFAALLLAAAIPARPGLFDDDEARRRIDGLRQELSQQGKDNEARIPRLEESIRNIGVARVVPQLLQRHVESPRLGGRLEGLSHYKPQIHKGQR